MAGLEESGHRGEGVGKLQLEGPSRRVALIERTAIGGERSDQDGEHGHEPRQPREGAEHGEDDRQAESSADELGGSHGHVGTGERELDVSPEAPLSEDPLRCRKEAGQEDRTSGLAPAGRGR